jgi:competence protein ComEA
MREGTERKLRELAKRAGLEGLSRGVLVAAVVVLAAAVGLAAWRWWPSGAGAPAWESPVLLSGVAQQPDVTATVGSGEASATASIWVHVIGAVRRPGLYELPAESRVEGAVEAAGGVLGNAAPEAVNLARKVADGEQVFVPTQDEARTAGPAPRTGAGAGGAANAGASGSPTQRVDLNSASADQLDTLPGIGPATAAKIVADREANGPYASVEDLGRVTGIGPKKLAELKDLVDVR